MALFARDERDPRTDSQTPRETSAEDPRRAAPAEPASREAGDVRAHLGKGSRISGKLCFDGVVRIEGEVEGEIVAKDTLIVEDGAVVTAGVEGGTIVVRGTLTGNVRATKRIEICPRGKVEGDLVTPALVIQEGARFDGRCSMGDGEARSEAKRPTPVAAAARS